MEFQKSIRVDGMPKEIDQLWENGKKILKESGAEIIDISYQIQSMLYQLIIL